MVNLKIPFNNFCKLPYSITHAKKSVLFNIHYIKNSILQVPGKFRICLKYTFEHFFGVGISLENSWHSHSAFKCMAFKKSSIPG